MKIRQKYTNDEGYMILFTKYFSKSRATYLRRVNGLVDKDLSKETTAVTYVNEYVINDLDLVKALCKLYPEASDHEIYNWYLDMRHPVYTYH